MDSFRRAAFAEIMLAAYAARLWELCVASCQKGLLSSHHPGLDAIGLGTQ